MKNLILSQVIKEEISKQTQSPSFFYKEKTNIDNEINSDLLQQIPFFQDDKEILNHLIYFYKLSPTFKEEILTIFTDFKTFDFKHTPSVEKEKETAYVKIESRIENQIYSHKRELEKISLYNHTIRVAKLAIEKYLGSIDFENLLLLSLLHDIGKSEALCNAYQIDTKTILNHEEKSALYLKKIFNKKDKQTKNSLVFILENHHRARRDKQDSPILKELQKNTLFQKLCEVDFLAREKESELLNLL